MNKKMILYISAAVLYTALVIAGYFLIPSGHVYNTVPAEAQIRVVKNIQDAQTLLGCAEDYLGEYADNLQHVRELLVRGANGIYTVSDREKLNSEIRGSLDECVRILEHARFNGFLVFYGQDGENSRCVPVTLAADEPSYGMTFSCSNFDEPDVAAFLDGLAPTPASMDAAIGRVDLLMLAVSMERARLGAYSERLSYSLDVAQALVCEDNGTAQQDRIAGIARRLENRLYALAVQSANGVYTAEDRAQIQAAFDELYAELVRINRSFAVQSSLTAVNRASVLTQPAAEAEMLALSGMMNR